MVPVGVVGPREAQPSTSEAGIPTSSQTCTKTDDGSSPWAAEQCVDTRGPGGKGLRPTVVSGCLVNTLYRLAPLTQ
jgi:hypothetical protein